jgi:hypothetical protein
MKAIALLQPWALRVAYGVKRIESRSCLTHYPREIAIHAGKRTIEDCDEYDLALRCGLPMPTGMVLVGR